MNAASAALTVGLVLGAGEVASAQGTMRVSVSSSGIEGNGFSGTPSISADGQFVAFASDADNLVAGDTNGLFDVFVRDRAAGTTVRVSLDSAGGEGNGFSDSPSISADGRFVAFRSDASNLVAGDTNGSYDVFVYDLATALTERISVDSSGVEGDSYSYVGGISADGQAVAFMSAASNLVSGDTNGSWDVFVHDRTTGIIARCASLRQGRRGPSKSARAHFGENAATAQG